MTAGIASEKTYPAKKKFYNAFINHTISDKKYEHAPNIWDAFTMDSYHDLYPKFHILLLVSVFETFLKEPINSFLDPAHCLSTPGFSRDIILWFLDVNSKPIADIEKYQFVKSTIRDGISVICKGS